MFQQLILSAASTHFNWTKRSRLKGPLLTREQEVELAKRVAEGNEGARHQLAVANLSLVVSIAKRYRGLGLPLDDLVGEGNVGLMKAIEKFDPEKGFKFSTYATWWIRQAIQAALRREARQRAIQRVDDEVLEALSFSTPLPEEAVRAECRREALRKALETLSERERKVLELRYGLEDDQPRTLKEAGKVLGISAERTRQLQNEALGKLREVLSEVGGNEGIHDRAAPDH